MRGSTLLVYFLLKRNPGLGTDPSADSGDNSKNLPTDTSLIPIITIALTLTNQRIICGTNRNPEFGTNGNGPSPSSSSNPSLSSSNPSPGSSSNIMAGASGVTKTTAHMPTSTSVHQMIACGTNPLGTL